MSKAFSKIKDPRLGLQDVLTLGKYKGCRVCDVLDDWEYLKWLHANTSIKFQQSVLDKITAAWSSWSAETHYQEEVAPYMTNSTWGLDDTDVPY
jgi:hypothetical protein